MCENEVNKSKWTDNDDFFLVQLLEEGFSYDDISTMMNRSRSSIVNRMKKKQLKKPNRRYLLYKNDRYVTEGTREEIAKFSGYTVETINQYIVRTKKNPENHNIHVVPIEVGL